VLVADGNGSSGPGGVLASAELYDPSTGIWSLTRPMSTRRDFHTATLLPNWTVLVAGGRGSSNGPLASAELYDPSTGTWSATAGRLPSTVMPVPYAAQTAKPQ
jgi:Galactose oxidase, central domain